MLWQNANAGNDAALRTAVDRSLAVISFDLDGKIVDANANFLATTGFAREDVIGRHHKIFVPEGEGKLASYASFWDDLRKGELKQGEFRRIAKGGKEIWLRATYSPVFDKKGAPISIVKIASDITAEKQRSLDDSGQLAAIHRSQAVIEFSVDGKILGANENFLSAMGYRSEEIVGQHHRMFVSPEEAASQDYARFWEELGCGKFQAAEYCRFAKCGKAVWIRATYNPILGGDGRPVKVVKFAINVTAEKLRNADYESQIAAINRTQAVISFALDGTILDANENFLKATGYPLGEVKGQHHRLFVEPNFANKDEYRVFWERLGQGIPVQGIYQRFAKGGRPIWLQATYNPILDAAGKPWKVVKYADDITSSMAARTRAVSAAESPLSNVESVADAAEDMSDTVRNLVTNMNGAKRAVTDINSQATTIDHSTNKMRDAAKSMDSVVQLIAQVAKETNMLALNATIEAARAGESGRGFAVVAQEVKSLAAQTANATTRISSEIAAMQTIADEVVTTLASVTGAIQQVHGLVETATSEIEAQSSVTVEISDNMRTTADDVASIARTLDDWIIGMEERRFDERRRVNTPVKLLLSNGASIAGSLRNLSRGGGKLLVADPQSVPDFFQLLIDGESDMRNCQVIRRGSNEIGVRFRSAMRA